MPSASSYPDLCLLLLLSYFLCSTSTFFRPGSDTSYGQVRVRVRVRSGCPNRVVVVVAVCCLEDVVGVQQLGVDLVRGGVLETHHEDLRRLRPRRVRLHRLHVLEQLTHTGTHRQTDTQTDHSESDNIHTYIHRKATCCRAHMMAL